MQIAAFLLTALLLVTPAAAQEAAPTPTLSIALGETVTVRVTPDGKFIELNRVRRPVSAAQTAPDTVSFSFFDLRRGRALLNTNGYRHILTYRTRGFVNDRAVATDLCAAVPGFASVQHWRDPLDRVELSEPHLVVEEGRMGPMCG